MAKATFNTTEKAHIECRCNNCCAGCGFPMEAEGTEYDHILSRKNGGEHTRENGQILCGWCNNKKNHDVTFAFLPRQPEWDLREVMANRREVAALMDNARGKVA